MTIPICKSKYSSPSVRTPKTFESYRRKINKWPGFKAPESVILCYDDRILAYVEKNHPVTKHRAFVGDFWFLNDTKNKVAIFGNFGLGSPIIGLRVEELIQFGIKKIISIGEAGAVSKDLKIGDIVICDKALRDEGVSYHYLKSSKYVSASGSLLKRIKSTASVLDVSCRIGPTWTTDAPYRQTVLEIRQFQKENVLTIDMEIASLFAIARYRKIDAGAIVTISDSLADYKWDPQFHNTTKSLEKMFEMAKNALLE